MKIAVLLFGHLRTFEQCWQGLRDNLLSQYDCDVFIHTWDETDHNTLTWHNREVKPVAVTEETLKLVREHYGPKALLVEHQQPIEEECFTFLIEPYTTVSTASWHYMFESLDKANRLRREYQERMAVQYDLVFATRPDIALYHPLDLESTLYQAEICGYDLERVRFYGSVPSSTKHPTRLLTCKGNDMLFFGRPCVMDRYIKANLGIDSAFFRDHILNVVAVYTAAEVRAGLEPLPISYQHRYDWMNIAPKDDTHPKPKQSKPKQKPKPSQPALIPEPEEPPAPQSLWKRAARKGLWVLYGPVRGAVAFARKHEWLLEK